MVLHARRRLQLAKDQKQADWAHDERQRRLPEAWELYSMSKWYKDHPHPEQRRSGRQKSALIMPIF